MKRMFAGVFGALLTLGLAGALATPAAAGGYVRGYGNWGGGGCNCYGPVSQVVDAGTEVVTTRRFIDTASVVPHVRVIDHTRVVLHRRTILHRQIIVHRHHTIDKDITVNRMNTAHRFQTVHKRKVENVYRNTRSRVHETRTVKGKDCNCGPGQANYKGKASWKGDEVIRARD
jgi:hypothetical protein